MINMLSITIVSVCYLIHTVMLVEFYYMDMISKSLVTLGMNTLVSVVKKGFPGLLRI